MSKSIKKPVVNEDLVAELQEELQEVRRATLRACRTLEGLPQASKGKKARESFLAEADRVS